MLQAFFHAKIAAERPAAAGRLQDPRRRPHPHREAHPTDPHVFGSVSVSSAADVNANWEEIKKAERVAKAADAGAPSVLDGVPFGQPRPVAGRATSAAAQRAGISVRSASAERADPIGDEFMAWWPARVSPDSTRNWNCVLWRGVSLTGAQAGAEAGSAGD